MTINWRMQCLSCGRKASSIIFKQRSQFMRNFIPTRRQFLALSSAALLSSQVPKSANAADTRTLNLALDWIPSVQYAGLFSAIQTGLFEEKKLKVDFTPGGPNAPAPLVLLAAGKADIAAGTWLSTLDAINKDNDLVIIAAEFPQSPGGILSLPTKPIRTAADINGKTMMIQDPALSVIFDGMLAFAGVKPDYKVIPTGFSADPLFAGDGDGYLCFVVNQPLELEARGLQRDKDFILASFMDLGYNIPETLTVVSRRFLTENRSLLVDYFEALLRGWQKHDAAPDTSIQHIVDTYGQDYGLEYEVERRKSDLTSKLTFAPGGSGRLVIEEDQITRMLELAKLTNRPAANPERFIDLSLLREATARL
ncbi:ABC transporter substrate-binding protein [Rhizobium sp. G187]|uniref:ABC transporter substrate-binding protein n=1 Tax=Rhizobium sp. G187 TaxID=3451352 RepID=UPI003EE76CB7